MDSQCYLCPHKGLYILSIDSTSETGTVGGGVEYCKMNQTPPYCARYNYTPPAPTSTVDYLTKMNYDLSEDNKRLREQIEKLDEKYALLESDRNYCNRLAEEFRAEIQELKEANGILKEKVDRQFKVIQELSERRFAG